MFNHLNFLRREFADVRAFLYKSSYKLVGVLILTPFPCTVWVSIVNLCSFWFCYYRALYSLKIKVFTTVVTVYALKGFSEFLWTEFSFCFIKLFHYAILRFGCNFVSNLLPCLSFCKNHTGDFCHIFPNDRIHFSSLVVVLASLWFLLFPSFLPGKCLFVRFGNNPIFILL